MQEEISKINSFFTAEDLLGAARNQDPGIGIATIYRFLKAASQKGKIHAYTCEKKKIYSMQTKSHCHFTCEKCKETAHFNLDKLDFIKRSVKGQVCHFQLDIIGICDKCKN
jgi:Fur family ferric uptake transcriptional regulator